MAKCIESTMYGRNLDYDYLIWIKRIADRLELTGMTYFKRDGSIKVIAEGEEKSLDKFINKIRRGKHLAIFSPIENFSVVVQEAKNEFADFSISEMNE